MKTLSVLRISRSRALLAFLLMVLPFGCVTNPVTGESEFSLLSPEEEKELGRQADQQIVAQYGVYDNPQLASWVDQLGQKIAAVSDAPDIGYTFRVLDSPVINAFALPGGYIYVTRGLLAYLQNEAQLAMVLGHEIGHVTARHSAQQYTQQQLAGLGVGIGAIVVGEEIEPFLGAISTGLQLLFLKFSRDDERQADELGVEYATRAGYQASEGAEFFEVLERLQNQQEGGGLPSWASTHPEPGERQQTIRNRAEYWHQQLPEVSLGGINPEIYLPKLDQVVFGDDPRQGFVANGTFYHPELRFQFPIPSGWQIGNFASQVQMAPQNGEAMIVFGTESNTSPSSAASQFASANNAQVVESNSTSVNGYSAHRLRSNVAVEDQSGNVSTLSVLSYFISKDGALFVFHGYTLQSQYGSYGSTFESVFTNFDNVTNASVLNVQPFRVDVFQASQSGQFTSLVQANSGAGLSVDDLAIMNQTEVSAQISAGTYLKEVE